MLLLHWSQCVCRCRRGFYVYNSIRCNYQKAASVIRRLIAEGPPPHFSADEGIGDVVDERGYNEMGSEWEHDSYMVETQDEEEIAAVADAVAQDSDAEDGGGGRRRTGICTRSSAVQQQQQ